MHLGYFEHMKDEDLDIARRRFLRRAGSAALLGSFAGSAAAAPVGGFKGEGRMGMSTGEDWIDTFFNGEVLGNDTMNPLSTGFSI